MTQTKKRSGCLKSKVDPSPRQTFRVNVEYSSLDGKLDQRLRKLVGRDSDGLGLFCLTRTRDIYNIRWIYKMRSDAEAALKRIKAAHIKGIKAEVLEQ